MSKAIKLSEQLVADAARGYFTRLFENDIKTSRERQNSVDKAVRKIAADTGIGTMKKGLLAGVRVHKFKVADKQYLLAYRYEKKSDSVTLLSGFGPA